jgi:ABC-type Fe3+-hydroxamate transport system substrate-binding protein
MVSQKPKLIFHMMMIVFFLSFTVIACNNSSDEKSSSDSTSTKMDTTPTMDTTHMMDTTNKIDTGKTRPVKPGE